MFWVVIVDDDAQSCSVEAAILKKEDMKVTTLASGEELLNYVEGMVPLPDLILLDVIMPGMSGFETLKKLREMPGQEGELPVIFLTGDEEFETEKKASISE